MRDRRDDVLDMSDRMIFESKRNQGLVRLLKRGKNEEFIAEIQKGEISEAVVRGFCGVAMDAPPAVMEAICQQVNLDWCSLSTMGFDPPDSVKMRHFYRSVAEIFVEAERLDWLEWALDRATDSEKKTRGPGNSLWHVAMALEKPKSLAFLLERTELEGLGWGSDSRVRWIWARQGLDQGADDCIEILRKYMDEPGTVAAGGRGFPSAPPISVKELIDANNYSLLTQRVEQNGLSDREWKEVITGVANDWWRDQSIFGEMWGGNDLCDPLVWLDVLEKAFDRDSKLLQKKYIRGLVAALRLDGTRGNDPRIIRWVEQMGGSKVYLTVERFSWCEPRQGIHLWEERMPKKLQPAIDRDMAIVWWRRMESDDQMDMLLERCHVAKNRSKSRLSGLAEWLLCQESSERFLRHLEPGGILSTEPREAMLERCRRQEYNNIPRNRAVAVETMGQTKDRFAL